MSTELLTKNEEVVGVQLARNGGAVLELDLTDRELQDWLDVDVCWETEEGNWKKLGDLLKVTKHKTQTEQTLNEEARKLEASRWHDGMVGLQRLTAELRTRARQCNKDTLCLV